MPINDHIREMLKTIPNKPGVYQYYDKKKSLLYIGKAKNLKTRVHSYFKQPQEHQKTKVLVNKIFDIKCVIVSTEMDALLLENNLIKKHQPKYNVLLKDSKTYPWICIKNEPFPRIFQTRTLIKDGSEYFGPYASVRLIKTISEFFTQLYPLRNCNLNLTAKNIKEKKFKACLEYHMKNCLGPCIGEQNENDYSQAIRQIRKIISGDIKSVITHLNTKMESLSKNLEFEKAQDIKNKIALLKNYQSKSTIVNPRVDNVDVFTIISDEKNAFVNFLKVKSGAIIQSHTLEIHKKLNEIDEKLLQLAIIEIRQKFNSNSKNVYSSHYLNTFCKNFKITVPKIGDKKKLIDLSMQNAKHTLLNKQKKEISNVKRNNHNEVLLQLQRELHLKNYPKHIECFDNSNTQGTNPVAACVVFKHGKPSKKDYRYFNIKTVNGPNDFASMEEVIYRRYKRILKTTKKLPNLIIVDGGKGQLNSALKSLKELNLNNKVPVIAIAKQLEEIYFPNDSVPLFLNKRSKSLQLIQQLRNEAHRFGILHHRNKRSKASLVTSLDNITGIGPKTVALLISHFGSIKKIKSIKKERLIRLIGKDKTEKILKN